MKRKLYVVLALMLTFVLLIPVSPAAQGSEEDLEDAAKIEQGKTGAELTLSAKSAVLMEASTGQILYAKNGDEKLPPASVTKIMALLLIMEALEDGRISTEDTVTTSEHAASMGGTQIYLEVGEQMSVNDLIKAIAIPSANDATVAMAEHLAGSEPEFVRQMNERAEELGMTNTHFTCCTGLFDDDEHYTTATDIARMTRELLKHEKIFEYSTVWMDSLRNGGFGLANTNKMLRTYTGMTGMKTGYTKRSGHCFSGTATRDGMTLIAVVLSAPSSAERFADTAALLNHGFAMYSVVQRTPEVPQTIRALRSVKREYPISVSGEATILLKKGEESRLKMTVDLPESVDAPRKRGEKVGSVLFTLNGQTVAEFDVILEEDVLRAGFFDYFAWLLNQIVF